MRLPDNPVRGPRILVFFHLVNKTGAKIRLRVQADGQEPFAQRLPGKLDHYRAAWESEHSDREMEALSGW